MISAPVNCQRISSLIEIKYCFSLFSLVCLYAMQKDLWQKIISSFSSSLDVSTYETWFSQLKPAVTNDSNILYLVTPNQLHIDFLEHNYKKNLLTIGKSLFPPLEDIQLVLSSKNDKKESSPFLSKLQFNKFFTFESFVVGPGNEFAKSVALAVAKNPGKTKFNPLLIYGGAGLGKTHLLHAVGNYISTNNSNLKLSYSSSEEFYFNFIDAIKNNRIRHFSEPFRSSNVLLIDDVQFFSGKESTQEEFFHIFNTLYQNQQQIILTSDLSPSSLKGLQDRLVSRFQWGLVVDIQPPNIETRIAILKKKAEKDNLCIPESILIYIAENISSNIRTLEGIIIKLLAFSSITKKDISLDFVKSILKENVSSEKSKISIEDIINIVATYFNVPVNNIREKNRRKEVAYCRQIAIYLTKNFTNYSLKSIGLHFGGRDHSTVIHSINTIENLKLTDPSVFEEINKISTLIKNKIN